MEQVFEKDWYKPICVKCPYFSSVERDDISVEAIKDVVKCERPIGSVCLGNNEFIQRVEVVEHLKRLAVLNKLADMREKEKMAAKRRKFIIPGRYKRGKIERR